MSTEKPAPPDDAYVAAAMAWTADTASAVYGDWSDRSGWPGRLVDNVNLRRIVDVVWTMTGEEIEAVRQRVAEYEAAITWDVTCLGCSKQLDTLYDERSKGYQEGLRDAHEGLVDVILSDGTHRYFSTHCRHDNGDGEGHKARRPSRSGSRPSGTGRCSTAGLPSARRARRRASARATRAAATEALSKSVGHCPKW